MLVFPPGGELARLAMLPEDIGLEDALNSILVDFTESVNSVKAVVESGKVVVELDKPRFTTQYMRINKCLGSLPVSIAGCVIASVLSKPVYFLREMSVDDKTIGFFEIDE